MAELTRDQDTTASTHAFPFDWSLCGQVRPQLFLMVCLHQTERRIQGVPDQPVYAVQRS